VSYSRDERLALCALLDKTGPDAPTLCAGWNTGDLAAHLVLRERRPDAAAGVLGGPLAGHTARVQNRIKQQVPFPDLVRAIRSGPPRLSPMALPGMDERFNAVEYFVHHEDVRRANGSGPRTNPPAEDAALFRNVARAGRLLSHRLRGAGLDLVWAGTDKVITARRGEPTAQVSGLPGELILFLFGRRDAADVEVTGPPDAIEALQRRRRPWWWGNE